MFLVSMLAFANFEKPSKPKLAKPWTSLHAALNWCNTVTKLYVKLICGGIKVSRVILESNRGAVHRGAPAVTPFRGPSQPFIWACTAVICLERVDSLDCQLCCCLLNFNTGSGLHPFL